MTQYSTCFHMHQWPNMDYWSVNKWKQVDYWLIGTGQIPNNIGILLLVTREEEIARHLGPHTIVNTTCGMIHSIREKSAMFFRNYATLNSSPLSMIKQNQLAELMFAWYF